MKSILSFAAAIVLAVSVFSVPAKAVVTFDDFFATDPFAFEVIYLHELGIITGYPDGTFRPNNPVTRAEAITMVGRALKLDGTKRATPFSDVSPSSFASGYIASAAAEGIVIGFPGMTFKPEDPVTRGQTAVILDRAFYFADAPDNTFSDVDGDEYYFDAISRLAYAGVAKGYPDNTFKPDLNVSRVHFAAFLARTVEPSFIPEKRELLNDANDILADLKAKNFESVADYVSADEGIVFCPYSGGCMGDDSGVSFTKAETANFMEDSEEYLWGYQDGSGFPIELTPAQYYDEYLMDAVYNEKERYGITEQPMTMEQIHERFPDATIVEFYYPGTQQYDFMDWQNLNMVFAKDSSGEWHLIAIVNNRWTI
ncbi:S-layer homology domain-containing protein [Planococcus sp. APC 3906]|uniref:S-layer homology domain-containing protein n=1 Tax=Planococcus sp. APC 3906 TaxID=3035194 RepID=UPI0025B2FC15|nr:S-layer homology domain-containing protein [Planococcus sp. APC 3906]MDN3448980.1 S-layer homology domain-containing protein [Planococcus sp. APC 3906]